MTASKGPTLLIARLREAAERKRSNDPRGCIFTQAAECLEQQAEKIRRMKEARQTCARCKPTNSEFSGPPTPQCENEDTPTAGPLQR